MSVSSLLFKYRLSLLLFYSHFIRIHGLSTHHGRIIFINSIFIDNLFQLEVEIQRELANNLPKWFHAKKGTLDYRYFFKSILN